MKRSSLAALGTLGLALILALPAQAGRVVDTAGVTEAVDRGAILWDIRDAEAYKAGHIPGAVNLGTRVCSQVRTPVSWDYIPIARIIGKLEEWGIDPGREIVLYSDKGSLCPYFILLTLELVGAENARVYHGGIDDWRSGAHPVDTATTTLPPVALDLYRKPGVIVSTDEVRASLVRRDVQILDVRTAGEFAGLDVRALRGGHIPGALNIPYEQNWVDPEALIKLEKDSTLGRDGFALKSTEELKRLYAGLDPMVETIVYCQTSPRASVTATLLKDIGFRDVRVYDGSWADYGNRFDLPAANETFFDMFALTSRIGILQRRIDDLERQLAEIKKKGQ